MNWLYFGVHYSVMNFFRTGGDAGELRFAAESLLPGVTGWWQDALGGGSPPAVYPRDEP
jgi:hypothetical protein